MGTGFLFVANAKGNPISTKRVPKNWFFDRQRSQHLAGFEHVSV